MLIVAGVALTIAVLALAFPAAFAHFDSYDIAWIGALLAMGGAIAWRMSKRTTDADPAAYGFNAPRPRSWAQGLTYALIWAAILFIAMAAYSLSDWAYNVGQLIRALIT
ncbi:MAG: hypothetical protein ABUL42_03585 [Terricaulis silvestris]